MVGVANRVRTMFGMPTMNVRVMPPRPASRAIHVGRMLVPGSDSNKNAVPMTVSSKPTPVQNLGIPT